MEYIYGVLTVSNLSSSPIDRTTHYVVANDSSHADQKVLKRLEKNNPQAEHEILKVTLIAQCDGPIKLINEK